MYFNDIIRIIDFSDNLVVEYIYNAFGNIINIIDESNLNIGTINPFRYRSYYYDTETNWYYLNSIYYNPKLGRFVTMDEVEYLGASGSLLSYNLYSYCEGNPICYSDESGNAPYLGFGIQFEGSIFGVSLGLELVWYETIASELYPSKYIPYVYFYCGCGIDWISLDDNMLTKYIEYISTNAAKVFKSASKSKWKRELYLVSCSLCEFTIFGNITDLTEYTGGFVTSGLNIGNFKTYTSSDFKGNVRTYGIGVTTKKLGLISSSITQYYMVPQNALKVYITIYKDYIIQLVRFVN